MALDRRRRSVLIRLRARRLGRLTRHLPWILSLSVIPAVVWTFAAMVVSGPGGPDSTTLLIRLALDAVLVLALGLMVGGRVARIWQAGRKGVRGSRLHLRFITLFAILALTPPLLMSVGWSLFFQYGVESWFSDRVRTALQAATEVSHAYLEEHQQIIGGDAMAMANDINREGYPLMQSPREFDAFVSNQAGIRGLSEAIVFERTGRILAKSGLAFTLELSLDQLPIWAYEKARGGDVAVITSEDEQHVRALVQLQGFFGEIYLYVGRYVDPQVLSHMERTTRAVAEYERLEGKRSGLEWAFSLVFVVVGLLLVVVAAWIGLTVANNLATPIAKLIDAAGRVRSGDYSARVDEGEGDPEIAVLSGAFNRMTEQLDGQRRDLIEANRELDERRRFTETVLAGVSAGVLGLDEEGRITLPNRSACELISVSAEDLIGQPLTQVLPELALPIDEIRRRPEKQIQREIKLTRGGRSRTLLARLAAERGDEAEILGYVVTFDDITELVSAQRTAAWADVARRIAHEIKNPLTPIQLSAERLKRKYLKQIVQDPETYTALVETIVRQVGDIGRMVDEFSSFARMPQPQMRADDLAEICRQALFLQTTGNPGVHFVSKVPPIRVPLVCDPRLIGQALTNLLKNAVEAITGREGEDLAPGEVVLTLAVEPDRLQVTIDDNGRGLPAEDRERLTEPYVTTRAKGTGLGLAIVKKIMEDHGGDLFLEDAPGGWRPRRIGFPPGVLSDSG